MVRFARVIANYSCIVQFFVHNFDITFFSRNISTFITRITYQHHLKDGRRKFNSSHVSGESAIAVYYPVYHRDQWSLVHNQLSALIFRAQWTRETACSVGTLYSCTCIQLNHALPTVDNQLRATLTGAQLSVSSERGARSYSSIDDLCTVGRALTTSCAVI